MAAVTSAVIAGVGVAGSIHSAGRQRDAARDATRAQTDAAAEANRLQWEMYQQGRTDNEPFRQNALTGQNMFMQMMGLGGAPAASSLPPSGGPTGTPSLPPGDFRDRVGRPGVNFQPGRVQQSPNYNGATANTGGPGQVSTTPPAAAQTPEQQRQAAFDLWRGTPGYQFNLDEGRNQIESAAAARGGLYSGAALKDLTEYGQNYADRTYGDYMNRLASLGQMGQTANSQNAQLGMNYANQAGANFNNAANARASGLQAGANANSDMWGNISGIGGWLAGQYGSGGMAGSPSTGFASGFGNNTGWLSGGSGFNNTPGGGGFSWLGGGP